MLDINAVKEQAEKEYREEKMKKATKTIKELLAKRDQAKQILLNVEKELADAYATVGEGFSSEPSNKG